MQLGSAGGERGLRGIPGPGRDSRRCRIKRLKTNAGCTRNSKKRRIEDAGSSVSNSGSSSGSSNKSSHPV